ncbi:MAG: hypothetical protein R3B55_00475 [Candidatus Paceibacterota bacterium]
MEKPFGENYRKELADDLKALRIEGDMEGAQKVLEEERETTRYKVTKDSHQMDRFILHELGKKEKEEKLSNEIDQKIDGMSQEFKLDEEKKIVFEKEMKVFLENYFKNKSSDISKLKIEALWQEDLDFRDLYDQEEMKEEFGKYIVNPESALLDYESLGEPEIFNPNRDQFFKDWLEKEGRQKNISSVMDYVQKTYKNTHHLPGIEYQKYLFENKDKIPESLKDGYDSYMPSASLRDSYGDWNALYGTWSEREGWVCQDYYIAYDWGPSFRVVLFKK